MKLHKCEICGNVVEIIDDKKVPVMCCGKKMEMLTANTEDGAVEKHVPVYVKENNIIKVKVGEVMHPMDENHYIGFISLVENGKVTRVDLKPGMNPEATFTVESDDFEIYEYCNLHGLYKTK